MDLCTKIYGVLERIVRVKVRSLAFDIFVHFVRILIYVRTVSAWVSISTMGGIVLLRCIPESRWFPILVIVL